MDAFFIARISYHTHLGLSIAKFQFIAHIQTIRRERIYPFRKVKY